MLATRLVQLIEAHSDSLSEELLGKFLVHERCSTMRNVPLDELHDRSQEVYKNLSAWLLFKTDKQVEQVYTEIGRRRFQQGVTLSHLLYALTMTKEHLFEYLQRESFYDNAAAVYGQLEFVRMLSQFFDRATFYAVSGYEQAAMAKDLAPLVSAGKDAA
jgi:hypothetical protein